MDLERRAEELSAQTDELRRSRERLVTVRDAQRHRLEQELRDGVGAEIAAIRDEIRDDAARVVADPDGVRASLERLSARTTVALDDLREVARGIFPPLLSDEGLAAALGALARRAGNETQLSILGGTPDTRYDAAVEAAIYFCCVQALQNAERHAPGRRVDLTLTHGPGEVSFSVRDRGDGLRARARVKGGEGLRIMQDRMAALGGTLTIESAPGTGTTVTGTLPARVLAGEARREPTNRPGDRRLDLGAEPPGDRGLDPDPDRGEQPDRTRTDRRRRRSLDAADGRGTRRGRAGPRATARRSPEAGSTRGSRSCSSSSCSGSASGS